MSAPTTPLWRLSAKDLVRGFASADFDPVDALRSVLARIDAVNGALNAVVTTDPDSERPAAASRERWRRGAPLSALDGVPMTVKDNLHVAGMRATWGSRLYGDFTPTEDEPAITRLRAGGALLFAKTNVPEFTLEGYTANAVFGVTGNALDPTLTPGGSTGGGASAVAAGIGPLAIGTDGGGSIRRPAAHCGVFGFKPSLGQIARWGGFPQLLLDFEEIGPVARTLGDLRLAFEAMRGFDPRDPGSAAATLPIAPRTTRPSRIAFAMGDGLPVDPEIRVAAERTAGEFEALGAVVQPVDLPFDPDDVADYWGVIARAHLARLLAEEDALGRVGAAARALAESGATISLSDYLGACERIRPARLEAAAFFARHDALLTPAIAALAWPAAEPYPKTIDGKAVGPRGHAAFTAWMNVAALPALSFPVANIGCSCAIGMQIATGFGRDFELFDLVSRWTASFGGARSEPGGPG